MRIGGIEVQDVKFFFGQRGIFVLLIFFNI